MPFLSLKIILATVMQKKLRQCNQVVMSDRVADFQATDMVEMVVVVGGFSRYQILILLDGRFCCRCYRQQHHLVER